MHNRQELMLCLASPEFYPPRGGAELRFHRYLSGFAQRGVCPFIITGTPSAHKISETDPSEKWFNMPVGTVLPDVQLGEFPMRRVRLSQSGGTMRSRTFLHFLLQFCNDPIHRPDVIQMLSYFSSGAVSYLSSLRATRLPIVYTYTLPKRLPKNPIKRIFRKWSLRKLYQQVDCVVTSSSVTRNILLDFGVKTKIVEIPNGVNLQRFQPSHNADDRLRIKRSLGLNDQNKMILNIGAIDPRKGIDLLLESWGRFALDWPGVHLFFIGMRHDLNNPKLENFRKEIERLVKSSGASDRVHFLGYVDNVEDYLKAADLFVFPSLREGMGNAVLEAMATGVPVILTPFIGLPDEFGQPGKHYLLVERNPDALGAAITALLEDEDRCKNLTDSGLRLARETMDIEISLNRYVALYRDLVEESRRRWTPKTGHCAKL